MLTVTVKHNSVDDWKEAVGNGIKLQNIFVAQEQVTFGIKMPQTIIQWLMC